MAQTVTQILLSQKAFTNTPATVSGSGSAAGNILIMTPGSPPLPIGVGIRGIDSNGTQIPAGTTISSLGPYAAGSQAYIITPPLLTPIIQTTITTITGITSGYEVIGERKPAASYYLGNKCLQTVNINVSNFTGTLKIEASLSIDPSDSSAEPSDWFTVHEFTADAQATLGSEAALAAFTNTAVNIDGNFVWMRARVVNFGSGTINWVKLSY